MICRAERIGGMAALASTTALVLLAGCGGGDESGERAAAAKPAAEASRVLGAYTQVLRVRDLPADADRASAGRYRLFLKPESFESFTPKGPGYAGEGRPAGGDRYRFGADYGRECESPATYAVREQGGRASFEAVGSDPCPLRREVLATTSWKRVDEP